MKRILLYIYIYVFALLTATAQTPYGYAPADCADAELSRIGSGKNSFVQGMVCFNPADDPALVRLRDKGYKIKGVRCYLLDEYAQKRQSRSFVCAAEGTPANTVRQTLCNFSAGWNDVLFDEPLPIGEDPIYLGLQVYETIGAAYPLMSYNGATVPQSCLVNIGKKSFEELTDRGTLLVFALFDDEAVSELDRTAYAQNVSSPQTVAPRGTFKGDVYILNQSATALASLRLATVGAGETQADNVDVTFDTPIPAYGHSKLTLTLQAGSEESTEASYAVSVAKFNESEAQAGLAGRSTLFVTVDNFVRMPLVEEFTSQACVNCPQMAYFLEKAFDQWKEQGKSYVYLSRHSGFREDAFTTAADRELTYLFGGYELEYNPAITYNRAVLEGESNLIQGVRDMSPEPYLVALEKAIDMPAKAEINIANTSENVSVTGRVSRDLVSKELFISLYLVEDGIPTTTYAQLGMDDADAPADLADVFRHNGVVLKMFNTAPLGDQLSPAADGTFSLTFPPIPSDVKSYGGTSQRLVALISRVNKENLRDNEVLNAAQLPLGTESGIQSINGKQQTSTIYDLQGRRQTGFTHSGIYIVGGKKVVK